MFHEVHEAGDGELRTDVSVQFLDYLLPWLRTNGWQIVSMDECAKRLASDVSTGRFVCLTFDDGYRDNVTRALPVLQRHNAPFTVYVPTGAINRSLFSWWLGLRELFRTHEDVEIAPMNARFQCVSIDEKIAALETICNWVHEDYRRRNELTAVFSSYEISLPALNDAYFIDEEELRELAKHPLATIGGHTVSHSPLTLLSEGDVHRELVDNRAYLANLLQRPIDHFAYPYGNCAAREFEIAARSGFSTAVTTQDALLTARTSEPYSLPRLGMGARDTGLSVDAKVSGLRRAVKALRPRVA